MFHLSMYSESLGTVTDSDVNAAADEILTVRNSHLIFTKPYDLLAAYHGSSTATRARFSNPESFVRNYPHLWPISRSDTIPSRPMLMDYRDMPFRLPLNEELTIQATTDAAGPVIYNAALYIGTPNWSMQLPQSDDPPVIARGTAVVVAGAASSWTALANITFEREFYNGVYAVVGADVIAANAIAFRLRFPTSPLYDGKTLRPGGIVVNTIGDVPWFAHMGGLGEWGRFHTFETLQLQTFDDTAGGTYEVRLKCLYLGNSVDLLQQQA